MLERRFDSTESCLHIDGNTIEFRENANLILVSIDVRPKRYTFDKDIRILGMANMKDLCPVMHDRQFRTYEYIPSVQDYYEWYKKAKKDNNLFKKPSFTGQPSKMNGQYMTGEKFLKMLPLEKINYLKRFKPDLNFGLYCYWDDRISIE